MNNFEEEYQLQLHSRPTDTISLKIPQDTLNSLNKIAINRDISVEALLKFYIGQGLRQDLAKLSQSITSEDKVTAIIQETQSDTQY